MYRWITRILLMAHLLPLVLDMNGDVEICEPAGETLKEVYLIVRPEEKYDLEAALQTVMAPIYSTINGLGRGSNGGLAYGAPAKRGAMKWFRKPELSVLLPKTIFYFVIPESRVESVVRAAGAVLRAKGGPGDRGLGVAIIGDVEADVVIGPAPSKRAASAPAAVESESGFEEGPP